MSDDERKSQPKKASIITGGSVSASLCCELEFLSIAHSGDWGDILYGAVFGAIVGLVAGIITVELNRPRP